MAYGRTRTRNVNAHGENKIWHSRDNGRWNDMLPIGGYESCSDYTNPGPPYRSGGPFLVQKKKWLRTTTPRSSFYRPWNTNASKGWIGSYYMGKNNYATFLSPLQLGGWGAKGWAKASPIKPNINIGRFLIELKDVPEMLRNTHEFFHQFKGPKWKGRSLDFWGNQYLNQVFGWLPFIQDLQRLINLASELEDFRNYLKRNNSQRIHKRVNLYSADTETVDWNNTVTDSMTPLFTGDGVYVSGGGTDKHVTHYQSKIWFEGEFKFFVPDRFLYGSARPLLDAQILGLLPDLNLIWQVTPWSWMADWFLPIGSILKNVSDNFEYNLVSPYAYVMAHQRQTRKYSGTHRLAVGYSPAPGIYNYVTQSAETTLYEEVLQREVASPYGFGLTWSGFNPYQLSVLAALGLSRSHWSL